MNSEIKKALEIRAKGVSADDRILKEVLKEIEKEEHKEVFKMKGYMKIAAVACVAVVLSATAVIGAGIRSSSTKTATTTEAIQHFPTAQEVEEAAGYVPKYVSKLGDYDFKFAQPANAADKDESGNTIKSYREIDFWYDAGEGNILSLNTHNGDDYITDKVDEEIEIDGITAYYSECTYMAVPPDYEPTDEEKSREESGELMIGYGSSKVEISETKGIIWEQDGITYNILSMGLEITKAEITAMAQQVINS